MKKAVKILSLVALIVAAVNLVLTAVQLVFAQGFDDPTPSELVFTVGLLPVVLWLFVSARCPRSSVWNGPIGLGLLLALFAAALLLSDLEMKNATDLPISDEPQFFPWGMRLLLSLISGAVATTAYALETIFCLRKRSQKTKRLSLSTMVFWQQIVVGGLWIVIAVLGCFDHLQVIDWLHLVLLLITLGLQLVMFSLRSDSYDEMALDNLKTAKAKTLDILTVLFILLIGASSLLQTYLPGAITELAPIDLIFLFLGLQGLISGLIFRKLEAN